MGVKEYSITDDSLEFGYKDAEDFESERLMIIFDVAKDLYCHNRNMSAKDAITYAVEFIQEFEKTFGDDTRHS